LDIQASGRGLSGHWPERRWPERHWPEYPGPLESIDKLQNGKQDVPEAREKIEAIFREAENELQSASQLMFQYEDQTEIRVWIKIAPSSGKTCFLSPKIPACNSGKCSLIIELSYSFRHRFFISLRFS
jgi:hypothetical protein